MEESIRQITLVGSVAPLVPALIFVLTMSLIREPARQNFNAIFSTGFATLYVNGGFGAWEFAYMIPAILLSYRGLRSYRFIGAAWLLHTFWDLAHHLWGNPLWHFAPLSSWGCAIMDAAVALWFFCGAPTLVPFLSRDDPETGDT